MKLRQGLIDTAGAAVALVLGVPYFLASFARAWDLRLELAYIATWLGFSVVSTAGVTMALTILLKPSNPWLYPVAFSLATLLFALSAMGQPIAAGFWLAVSAATIGIGYASGRLAQRIVRYARRTKL